MNADDLRNALVTVINQAVEAAKAGAEFMKEQIPDVVNQLLLWKALQSAIPFLVGVVILICVIVAEVKGAAWASKAWKKEEAKGRWADGGSIVFVYFLAHLPYFALIPTLIYLFSHMAWLQILVAPKIYLIEYGVALFK